LWIYGIAFILLGTLFATKWRRSQVLTDAELTELRYSGSGVLGLRVAKALYYGTLINCVVLAMVLLAALRIGEVFMLWHEWLPEALYAWLLGFIEFTGLSFGEGAGGLSSEVMTLNHLLTVLSIMLFTVAYSATGGLRSVISTDLVQFGLAIFASALYAGFVLYELGGLGSLRESLVELYGQEGAGEFLSFRPQGGDLLLGFLVIISLQWLFQMNSDGTGYLAQRSMACRTDREARIAALVFCWAQIVLRSLIWLIIAVGILVLYPFDPVVEKTDLWVSGREALFIRGIDDLLPIGIRGLMLTGLLAALASTIDTHLNWGASYWSNDIYKRLVCEHFLKRDPKSRELVWVARLSNFLLLIIALVVMANIGSIQQAWKISLLFGAGMGSVLVLRWLWERINLWSEFAAILASLTLAPILLKFVSEEWLQLLWMAGASTTAAVVVTFFTPKTQVSVLQEFYRKVQPSGFWRGTANSLGESGAHPLRKLLSSLKTTALCIGSVFSVLMGCSKLMLPVPGEPIWLALSLLAFGAGLTYFWWPKIFAEDDSGTVGKLSIRERR
ncbi:MAG: sodium transporter, partial [Bradymonadales bacterium]